MTQPGSLFSYEKRIIGYIQDGYTPNAIAQREGMNTLSCRKLVKQLVRDHNLNYKPYLNDPLPYGLTNESFKLRIALGNMLYELTEKLKDVREVSAVTGLNMQEQVRARQRPYSHDWTLSQIERLSAYYGKTITEIL